MEIPSFLKGESISRKKFLAEFLDRLEAKMNSQDFSTVIDEWKLISLIQQYMRQQQQQQQDDDLFRLAATCWDIEDGDILMIQSAYELPTWVHAQSDEAAYCRNRCWILQGRGITLIAPDQNNDDYDNSESLSLEQALQILQQEQENDDD